MILYHARDSSPRILLMGCYRRDRTRVNGILVSSIFLAENSIVVRVDLTEYDYVHAHAVCFPLTSNDQRNRVIQIRYN
jgi:hypothetical protein